MKDSIIKDLKRQDLSQLRYDLEEEYNHIKRDRDYAREKLLTSGDNSINIPVN